MFCGIVEEFYDGDYLDYFEYYCDVVLCDELVCMMVCIWIDDCGWLVQCEHCVFECCDVENSDLDGFWDEYELGLWYDCYCGEYDDMCDV